MLITVIGIEENSTYTKDVFNEDLSDGWMLSQPDGTRAETTFPYDYQDENPNIQIIRTLPQVPDHAVLQIILYSLERTGKERTLHLTRILNDDSDDTLTPGTDTVTIVTE